MSIEDRSDLSLKEKEDFQTLIIQEQKLPSGFINEGSFQYNSFSEAIEAPSVTPYDIFNSIGHLVDVIKNNPNELAAALGPDSYFLNEVQKVSTPNIEEKLSELWESLNKKHNDDNEQPPFRESAFNSQTGLPCFTSRQMTILMTAVGRITENGNPPGKTTLGDIVQRIAGYGSTTASQNMRGTISDEDKKIVADVLKSKFPKLATEVMKVN